MQANFVEKIMYKATMERMKEIGAEKICKEQSVELPHGRKGSYDFVAEIKGQKIGFEVLCRPTKRKLKDKLRYLPYVDKYVFVLPANALSLYKRPNAKVFGLVSRPKFLPKEFGNKKLYVWLCDLETKHIFACAAFSRIFNVEEAKSTGKK